MRLPGENIELTPSRAAALRGYGLIGGEYIEPKKFDEQPDDDQKTNGQTDDEQPDDVNLSDEQADNDSTINGHEKIDEQPEKTETTKSTESRKRVK